MRKGYALAAGILLLITVFASPTFAQGSKDGGSVVAGVSRPPSKAVQRKLDAFFYGWKTYQLDLVEIERAVRRSGRVQLDLGGRLFDLDLQPNDVRTPGYVEIYQTSRGPVRAQPSAVATFKGTVVGVPDSVVRLVVLPGLFQGYIKSGEEWLFVDPLLKYVKDQPASQIVVFDERDVRPGAAGLCGAGELHNVTGRLPALGPSVKGDSTHLVKATSTYRRVDLATEADYEYYSIYGSNANSQIQGVINQADGIYMSDLSVTLRIAYQSVWTTSNDPYDSSNPNTLLNQFRNYWESYHWNAGHDAAHLFTGRDMEGNIIGIAWPGVICNNPSYAYGVSQDSGLMAKLVSHEIGHNLAAKHDDEVSPAASSCDGFGTIMCSKIQANGPNYFSHRSKNDISSHVTSRGSCLEAERILIEPPSSTTTPSLFERYLGWGNLGQCGYDSEGLLYGFQGVEAGTWTKPVRMDMDNRPGGCIQEFGLYDPSGRLAGLQLKVDFGGTENQCWYRGTRTVPISSSFSSNWSTWSSQYRLDTDDKAGYCTQTFSIEGRSDVALDVSFEAESNNGQCGNVGTFPVVLGRSATFIIDTDGRSGGCRQKFRLRLNADADNDGVGDQVDSCPYVYGTGQSGCGSSNNYSCGNGWCENGESISCPYDCGGACGNFVCDPPDSVYCPDECSGGGSCGNFNCDPGEDSFSCPDDCGGGGGGTCGNFVCDYDEDASSCPTDCCVPGECQ